MRASAAPGPWLRLSALAGVGATALVVASASLELGRPHWGFALAALPPLVAVAIAAYLSYRPLLPAAGAALLLLLAAMALGGVVGLANEAASAVALHVAGAAAALTASLFTAAQSFRRASGPAGPA